MLSIYIIDFTWNLYPNNFLNILLQNHHYNSQLWCTPKLFDTFKCESKMKTLKGQGVGTRFLACNILGVEGHAEALGWGLKKVTSKLIIHTNLHNLNNKLVSA